MEDMDLTINSFEVVSTLPSKYGNEMKPTAAGRVILVLHSTFTNKGTDAVDLTCLSLTNWYMQGFDTADNELAHFSGMYDYPGNPECNSQLMNGETAAWSFAFEMPEASQPGYLTFTDTRNYVDIFAISLNPDLVLEWN